MDTNNSYVGPDGASRPSACPACGSSDVKEIVFGLPTAELFDDPTVALGGCVIPPGPPPEWHCGNCSREWSTLDWAEDHE